MLEFQQRKCCVIFDLSCSLAKVLEFFTREIPRAFLSGADTNLQRLTEVIVFVLSNISSAADAEFFDLWVATSEPNSLFYFCCLFPYQVYCLSEYLFRVSNNTSCPYCRSLRRNSQSLEKVNRGMILSPLVRTIMNLLEASLGMDYHERNDIARVLASMDFGIQCLLDIGVSTCWIEFSILITSKFGIWPLRVFCEVSILDSDISGVPARIHGWGPSVFSSFLFLL